MTGYAMKRSKQAMYGDEIFEILDRNTHGVLGVYGLEDYPYTVPMSYVCLGGNIYFHCAKSGHKMDAILVNPHVCFCVVDEDHVLPERFTTRYKSVVVFGTMSIVEDEKIRNDVFHAFMDKYCSSVLDGLKEYEIEKVGPSALIMRLEIEMASGKKSKEYMQKEGI